MSFGSQLTTRACVTPPPKIKEILRPGGYSWMEETCVYYDTTANGGPIVADWIVLDKRWGRECIHACKGKG